MRAGGRDRVFAIASGLLFVVLGMAGGLFVMGLLIGLPIRAVDPAAPVFPLPEGYGVSVFAWLALAGIGGMAGGAALWRWLMPRLGLVSAETADAVLRDATLRPRV